MLMLKTNWKSNEEFALLRKNELPNELNDFKFGRLLVPYNCHENMLRLACCRMRHKEKLSHPTGVHPRWTTASQLVYES